MENKAFSFYLTHTINYSIIGNDTENTIKYSDI